MAKDVFQTQSVFNSNDNHPIGGKILFGLLKYFKGSVPVTPGLWFKSLGIFNYSNEKHQIIMLPG